MLISKRVKEGPKGFEKLYFLILPITTVQSGQGHRDDRAKNRSKNIQRLDHKIGPRRIYYLKAFGHMPPTLMHRHAIKILYFFPHKQHKWTTSWLNRVQTGRQKGSQSAPFGASKGAKMSTGSDRGRSRASQGGHWGSLVDFEESKGGPSSCLGAS